MDLPKIKSPLKNFSYSSPGYYFVTVCTHNKVKYLSEIKTKTTVGAIHESPETTLTPQGEIVDAVIRSVPERFGVKIDKYVIMPNHFHAIIIVPDNDNTRAILESPLRKRNIIDMVIGYIKMNSSKQIHLTMPNQKLWQRSFHDHVIRGEKDYLKIYEYIENNPVRWESDCFYTK